MIFPLLTNFTEVLASSEKRWIAKEYVTAIFNQEHNQI